MLNDVVSIILYHTVIRPYNPDFILWEPVLQFVLSLVGSIVFGIATGLFVAFVLKKQYVLGVRTQNVEAIVMFLCPWTTYLIADVRVFLLFITEHFA